MRQILQAEWAKLQLKVDKGFLTQLDVQRDFEFDYGEGNKVFYIEEAKLSMARHPLKLD